MLINVEPLEDALELVLYSEWLKNVPSLSALLTAPVGAGKTELLREIHDVKGVDTVTDLTAYGILRDFGRDIEDKRIRHLIINDLLSPLAKQKSTRETFIAFLNALTEEGVERVSTWAMNWKPKREGDRLRCGVIAAIPKEDLLNPWKKYTWMSMGFISRFVPISYDHSGDFQLEVSRNILEGGQISFQTRNKEIVMPEQDTVVETDFNLTQQLLPYAAREMNSYLPYRKVKQLEVLVMANALKNGRSKITQEDVDKVKQLMPYISLDYPKMEPWGRIAK